MINRLRRQFILIATVSITLVVLLMALSINVINFISTNADLGDTLKMISENQGMIPQFSTMKPSKPPDAQYNAETPYSTRYFVLFYTGDGTLELADMKHIAAVTEDDADSFLAVALKHGEGMGYTSRYKYYVVSTSENQYMAVFLDCTKELSSIRTFAFISLLVAVSCVVLVFILIWFFSKKAMEPTVKSVEKQKQFITDASHELKTPLTVISTCLKVLEMEVGQQKWIDKAQGQTEKMSELVGDLVTLARLDEEKPQMQVCDFDISSAVTEAAESFRDYAQANGHELEIHVAHGLTYHGDEYAVRQMVSILLDNAVKYTDSGGAIKLCLERGKKGVVLKASNPCTGLDDKELDKLFDRFYRPDRSRSKQTGGFGVGLSIARSIAEAHKGSIRAECPSEGVIQFTAVLR